MAPLMYKISSMKEPNIQVYQNANSTILATCLFIVEINRIQRICTS